MTSPAASVLPKILAADHETGRLYWLTRTPDMFQTGRHTAAHTCAKWNAARAGREAFTALTMNGYLHGRIWGRGYLAHRVIWALATGEWPTDQIDHINGNRSDNRLCNLRSVSHAENAMNVRRPASNTSGHIGICKPTRTGRWVAYITIEKSRRHLGSFDSMEAALSARQSAERQYGFHENHGNTVIAKDSVQ